MAVTSKLENVEIVKPDALVFWAFPVVPCDSAAHCGERLLVPLGNGGLCIVIEG